MTTRGRKPTPTALRALRGNPQHRPMPEDEPTPDVGRPSPPEELVKRADALAEWNRVVPVLEQLGLLTKIDRAALSGYCMAYARWIEAERELSKSDALIVKTKTGYPMQNPLIGIANQQLKLMHGFIAEFGLSPASRTRVRTSASSESALKAFTSAKPKGPKKSR